MRIFKTLLASTLVLMAVLSGSSHIAAQAKFIPVDKYDPKRDAAHDIQDAIAEAQRNHKRILLEVGGLWCSWCHTLDNFFATHTDLLALRDRSFVTVKINFSEENENKEVLSRYGPVESYPHIFILDSEGKLLLSQDTGVLESGKSYDLEKLTSFLKQWSPPSL
jgi:thioredoxin-related protein